jgi:tRNA A-37 threonylcarbamoyl transferase component Bud32
MVKKNIIRILYMNDNINKVEVAEVEVDNDENEFNNDQIEKDELCYEFGFYENDNMKGSIFDNMNCYKCDNLRDNFNCINFNYDINNLKNMIEKINKFDNNKLKLFAIEIYNIINQTQMEYKNKNEFRRVSIKNMKIIKNMMTDLQFSKMKTFSDQHDQIYKVINNYVLLDEIGQGTQGIVYLSFDEKTCVEYAIKEVININKLKLTNKYENLKREIAIMKNANHENIVKLYDVIEDKNGKSIYMVMQYIEGGSILKKINERKYQTLPLEKVIFYVKQLISGLSYLHYNNIIHHDIKPENILLGKCDDVYLSDFGVSEILTGFDNLISNRNGTFIFFPPEFFMLGAIAYGPEADIWAFGVTIFLMIYGTYPFEGKNYEELKYNVVNTDPKYPDNCCETQKDFFDKIFMKDPTVRISLSGIKKHNLFATNSTKHVIKDNTTILNIDSTNDDDFEKSTIEDIKYPSEQEITNAINNIK